MPESKGQVITTEPIGMDSEKRYYWHFGGMLYISYLVMIDLTCYILLDSPWLWREKAKLKTGCRWETGNG